MVSSNHGKVPQIESSSDQFLSNTDSLPPPPPVEPPHMMYYPPGSGYPGHGPPPQPDPYMPPQEYAPYPNEYPHGYNDNYPRAPYNNVPQKYRAVDGGRGFIRGFIMCSCILFTGFFVYTLVLMLTRHPKLPVYKVSSLSVTNFNTTPILTSDWNISITVQNPNDMLRGYISDFKVDVAHENDAIAVTSIPDFELEKHEEKQMGVKASSSNGANGVSFEKWDLDKITKERESGSVTFGVRVSSSTVFKITPWSRRSVMMLVICEGVKVVFQNNTGTGTMDNGGTPIICQLDK